MTTAKYFEKTGKIYGVSTKYEFGDWNHVGYVFDNLEDAYEWLHTEEYDFRTRELMSRTAAEKLCGKGNFIDRNYVCVCYTSGKGKKKYDKFII